MQFTSIPSWFSIGQSVAELHIVWWTLHATQVNDFTAFNLVAHALLLIATTSSSTTSAMLVINCRAGVPKLTWRQKAMLQLSVFFQGDCAWVRTRQPEINVSKRRFRGERVIAVVGSRAIMFDKMGPSNPAEHFSKRLPKCAVLRGGWVGISTDLSLGGLLFLLPSYQVNGNKLLPIYSGISSWVWWGADRQRC